VPRGGGRQKDEKVARCRRTSVVYVKTTRFVERDVEIFANYGYVFRFAGGCVCHLCCVDGVPFVLRGRDVRRFSVIVHSCGMILFNLGMNKFISSVNFTSFGMKSNLFGMKLYHSMV
jgi:hypothetical protein